MLEEPVRRVPVDTGDVLDKRIGNDVVNIVSPLLFIHIYSGDERVLDLPVHGIPCNKGVYVPCNHLRI